MARRVRDPEAAYWDDRIKLEAEDEYFALFVAAYCRATGIQLTAQNRPEPPDYLCVRENGSLVGVELTEIRRSPKDSFWQRIIDRQHDMCPVDAVAEFERLLSQKARKLDRFPVEECILVFLNCETEFNMIIYSLIDLPLSDLAASGFSEIWLGDYRGIREHAHYEIELFGIYPSSIRKLTARPDYDQKPYG